MEGDRQRTLVAGCDGYIQKPIDVDAFPGQVAEFLEGKRERVESREEGTYLRELNQRLVYRLVSQVEDLKGLNEHVVRRAGQLEALHESVRDVTSELGVVPLLERMLPALARALGVIQLTVELFDPAGVRVTAEGSPAERPHKVLESAGVEEPVAPPSEWKLPLVVQGRDLGYLSATIPSWPGGTADEEQLLKIVAHQVAIAVENTRLYRDMQRRAAEEQSLTEAGRLLAGTLELPQVLNHLADLARTRLEADLVRIWLRDGENLRLSASSGAIRTRSA